jgi:vanillin dehydrogenase
VIDGHVEDAVGKGAKLLCGATHEAQYYWPTVLSGVTREMRIFREVPIPTKPPSKTG